VYGMLFNV